MTDTQFLSNTYNDQNIVSTSIHKKFKEVFKFLEWKTNEYDPHFSIRDREIISSSMYGQYHELSDKACTYTQQMMKKYTEAVLWNSTLKTQFQLQGYHDYPSPKCETLSIPASTKRKSEVLLMSMMYKNNILRSSLYKIGKAPSPICSLCAEEEETADHILFRCRSVDEERRTHAFTSYKLANNLGDVESTTVDFIGIVNASRNKEFVLACINIMNDIDLDVTVELSRDYV